MTIAQRIKILRKELGLSQKQFGDTIGIGQDTVSKIEGGVLALTDRNAKIIYEKHSVNPDWLMKGKGEKFVLPVQKGSLELSGSMESVVDLNATVNRLLDNAEAWREESQTWKQLYLSSQKSVAQKIK